MWATFEPVLGCSVKSFLWPTSPPPPPPHAHTHTLQRGFPTKIVSHVLNPGSVASCTALLQHRTCCIGQRIGCHYKVVFNLSLSLSLERMTYLPHAIHVVAPRTSSIQQNPAPVATTQAQSPVATSEPLAVPHRLMSAAYVSHSHNSVRNLTIEGC